MCREPLGALGSRLSRSSLEGGTLNSSAGRAPLPRWVWPLTLVVVVALLATFGRYLVAGLFAVVAVAFVLALACAVVCGLLAMAGPGPRGSLRGFPGFRREARARAREARLSVVHRVGQAPWRSPQRVVQLVMDQLAGEVFEMPSGPAPYSHLRVRMHGETLQMLDRWMPIQDVARTWADHYLDTHRAIHGIDDVTVSICGSQELPRGRALIDGAFRAQSDGADTWARARRSLGGQGEVVLLRADHPQYQTQAADTRETSDQAELLDPDATLRIPAASARSAGMAGAHRTPVGDERTVRAQATQLDLDATVRVPEAAARPAVAEPIAPGPLAGDARKIDSETARLDPDATGWFPTVGVRPVEATPGAPCDNATATERQAGTRLALGFQRVDPVTQRVRANAPEFFDSPRICVGRDRGMDLSIDDSNVSREHAELRRVNDLWTITDTSKNGTTINGTRLTPGKRYPINDGDIIGFDRIPRAGTPTYRVVLNTDAQGRARR